METEPFRIDSESLADVYLKDLFKYPNNRSIEEVQFRAKMVIRDEHIKNYFLEKAEEMLKAYKP